MLYRSELREIQCACAELTPEERSIPQNVLNIVNRNRYRQGFFGNDLMSMNEFKRIVQVLKE
ncbi:hypothetical protein [Candidatus Harpocratesius sp.]